jgi:poly(3-hydroxybutyrate) depolymerase
MGRRQSPLGDIEMSKANRFVRLAGALGFMLASGEPGRAAERLGSYPVDPAQVSVAGFSSGAFMASQLHVAHSAGIMGAAMIAGGLYGCAVENVTKEGVEAAASQAFGPCVKDPSMLDAASAYKKIVDKLAANGWIDPPSDLARAKLYIFTGGADALVASGTAEMGRDLYLALGVPASSIVFEDRSGRAAHAGHAWLTKAYGGACADNASPFINDCAYDQAGAELRAIYGGNLEPPAGKTAGRLAAFDQTEFVPDKAAAANGLSKTGYLYVPKDCEPHAPKRCRAQVVLHGCGQSAEVLRDVFITRIGVNEWADANRIIVLYPQAHATSVAELPASLVLTGMQNVNPAGCWNWWGYAGDMQYLTKKGVQIDAIWKMIERLEGK